MAIKYREIVLEALPEELEAALQLGYDWISKGSLEKAREVFEGVTRQALTCEEAEQVCRGLKKIGDVLMELLDYRGALIAGGAGLETRKALSQRDPDNTKWQRELSISHDKIGDALMEQEDYPGALAAYHKGLEIAESLAQRDRDTLKYQYDLGLSYDKVGNVLEAQGDSRGALATF